MALKKEEKSTIVKKYGKSATDTGSAAVQVALLTKRIEELTAHLKANKQDACARRSLLILVGKRRSLLEPSRMGRLFSIEGVLLFLKLDRLKASSEAH